MTLKELNEKYQNHCNQFNETCSGCKYEPYTIGCELMFAHEVLTEEFRKEQERREDDGK